MEITPIASSVITIFIFVSLGFILSTIIKRNDIADVMWGPGIALAAASAFWPLSPSVPPTNLHLLVMVLIGIWAARLGLRIHLKNKNKGEDARYRRWRETWNWFYLRSYLQVFLLQGFLMIVLASGVILAADSDYNELTWPILLGGLVWLIGFFFEVVGDQQLDRFLKQPENKGKLMTSGLWRYTRHPNYFGEITMWWGIAIITFTMTSNLLVLISPITITLLILYISGIPLLEASMKKHPEWDAYAARTNKLLPGPVKTSQ